tara:strand:+ start:506 stop:1510 length:1005 start_codon:yes stop_codon:yes gene_type:complete
MSSFLDNSGDIIVYATLTALGRARATGGTGLGQQIVKFCVFDDEINYGLYDKNNASGSAYADLEIMQTPIMQPQSMNNPTGKYGLSTRPYINSLYMVTAKVNELLPQQCVKPYQGIYYLAVNDGTTGPALKNLLGESYVLEAGLQNGLGIVIETGITDATAGVGDQQSKQRDIISQGLMGTTLRVRYNTNVLAQVLGPGRGSYFNNNGGNGRAQVNLPLQPTSAGIANSTGNVSFGTATIRVINNQMVYRENDNEPVTANSVIASSRAGVVKLNFNTRVLTDSQYAEKGRTSVTSTELFGQGSGTYKTIDTMVSLEWSNGATMDLPIRLIKKNS